MTTDVVKSYCLASNGYLDYSSWSGTFETEVKVWLLDSHRGEAAVATSYYSETNHEDCTSARQPLHRPSDSNGALDNPTTSPVHKRPLRLRLIATDSPDSHRR
ncbi:MAG: hypothetical protein J3Q66DRAFT_369469 [Benniella sp.]|nr:MAG: hypothetical protein J3Q66DRAFT_369469 [Benniella sp.]